MRARYPDPGTGRFISEDPIGFESGQTNLYAYAGGNPLRLTDPSGLKVQDTEFRGSFGPTVVGQVGPVGASLTACVAFDTTGTVCSFVQFCGAFGFGVQGTAGLSATAGTGQLESGFAESGGLFFNSDSGGVTVLLSEDSNGSIDIDAVKGFAGKGGGAAAGVIKCVQSSICFK